MQNKVMTWIDLLPNVDRSLLLDRDRLALKLTQACALEKHAAMLRAGAKVARALLIEQIVNRWPLQDIENAARASGECLEPFPEGYTPPDPFLRDLLRDLHVSASALDVLRAFAGGQVIRQHNLLSTATEEERRETLSRVLDWWNFGAVPVLARFDC